MRLNCFRVLTSLICWLALASSAQGSEIWLYTLVAADFDGAALLPHFLEHYHDLKIPFNRMLVNVHHNPQKYDRVSLDMILGICASYRVYCRIWEGVFSSEAHYNRTLVMLQDFVYDPDNWVVVADSDEFQHYGGKTIPDYLAEVDVEGASYITGTLEDRLAPGGALLPIAPSPTLDRQFPLSCRVVKNLYKGWDFKVVAFKNYLRAGRANHIIVRPDKARAYFGPCPPGQKCPRGRNINLEEDWFHLTPYHALPYKYRYKDSPSGDDDLWEAVEASQRVSIPHFKWHLGVLNNMRDRAEYYSGDCVLGVNEGSCTPLLLHWRESVTTYAAIRDTRTLNLEGMGCQLARTAEVVPSRLSTEGLLVDVGQEGRRKGERGPEGEDDPDSDVFMAEPEEAAEEEGSDGVHEVAGAARVDGAHSTGSMVVEAAERAAAGKRGKWRSAGLQAFLVQQLKMGRGKGVASGGAGEDLFSDTLQLNTLEFEQQGGDAAATAQQLQRGGAGTEEVVSEGALQAAVEEIAGGGHGVQGKAREDAPHDQAQEEVRAAVQGAVQEMLTEQAEEAPQEVAVVEDDHLVHGVGEGRLEEEAVRKVARA